MSTWTAAEILLGLAAIALMLPQEETFLLPERRDWLAGLRRFSPRVRRQREEAGAREADAYVAELHGAGPEAYVIRASELPSAQRRFETVLLTESTGDQRAPWELPQGERPAQLRDLIEPQRPDPEQIPPRRAPRNPPTIVTEVVRPNIASDLHEWMRKLEAEAGYPPEDRRY
jgi:hypothetical protein